MQKLLSLSSLLLFSVIIFCIPIILIIIHCVNNHNHICKDLTHQTCDGNCECDGLECGTYIIHPKHCMCEFCIEATDSGSRDYTIKESKDSIFTYNQGNKLIESYSIHNNNTVNFDYHLIVHYDTVWLYSNTGVLISQDDFDSIPQLIIKDNL